MNIRPQDLPELRAELQGWHGRYAQDYFTACINHGAQRVYHRTPDVDTASRWFANTEGDRIAKAELFYVTRDMTELVVAAARSMPDWNLAPEDLPAPRGLIYFEGLPTLRPFPTTAMTWGPCPQAVVEGLNLKGAGIWLSHYVDTRTTSGFDGAEEIHALVSGMPYPAPPLLYDSESMAAYGEREEGDIGYYRETGAIAATGVTNAELIERVASVVVIKAAWLLIQQGIATQTIDEPDRAARKRMRREGHEPTSVRVIELRRPKSTSGTGDGDREYHHQWIVRGHWRQQYYSSRDVHRPVWIAPHIKGPEGAPLIGGEKVYALKR